MPLRNLFPGLHLVVSATCAHDADNRVPGFMTDNGVVPYRPADARAVAAGLRWFH